jgi:hypothetical protein
MNVPKITDIHALFGLIFIAMEGDWKALYERARRTKSPRTIEASCAEARSAIDKRLIELAKESSALEDALRKLFVWEERRTAKKP